MLSLAILLPKLGTALAMALPGGVEVIVICTGDGIQTLRLGPDGQPLSEDTTDEAPCTLGNLLVAEAQMPDHWQVLARRFDVAQALRARAVPLRAFYARRKPARAPPVLTV